MATRSTTEQLSESPRTPREIEVPAPTAWPFILAFGAALLFAGLVTSMSVSCLGAVLALAGSVGWFREVFPHEHEEVVPVLPEDIRLTTDRRVVDRLPVLPDQVRAWLPVHTYPISAGVKGGLAGSIAMAVLACALRRAEGRKHLVSDQSSCRSCLSGIVKARACTAVFISCGCFRDCALFCTVLCPSLLGCSTARCCPCSHAVRLCLEDSLPQCCGQGYCTQSWDC